MASQKETINDPPLSLHSSYSFQGERRDEDRGKARRENGKETGGHKEKLYKST